MCTMDSTRDHTRQRKTRWKKSLSIGASAIVHLVLLKNAAGILSLDHDEDFAIASQSSQASVSGLRSECNVLAINLPALLIAASV